MHRASQNSSVYTCAATERFWPFSDPSIFWWEWFPSQNLPLRASKTLDELVNKQVRFFILNSEPGLRRLNMHMSNLASRTPGFFLMACTLTVDWCYCLVVLNQGHWTLDHETGHGKGGVSRSLNFMNPNWILSPPYVLNLSWLVLPSVYVSIYGLSLRLVNTKSLIWYALCDLSMVLH